MLTVLDSIEMALRASATELNSTMPHPLEVPSSCCDRTHTLALAYLSPAHSSALSQSHEAARDGSQAMTQQLRYGSAPYDAVKQVPQATRSASQ